ncbi:MAG: DUF362 domain-containing protein [Bacteroidota bacterium]|nr:DUF362 domain-containing protein [Bacteroidota bacterium]MDP4275329.1 DUF362 domain-containing protein [Bacteroidota bacterium]
MERRDFIKKSVGTGLLTGSALIFSNMGEVMAETAPRSKRLAYDLVAVKGGEPEIMFDMAIAALGGMKNFVKKGQTVVVKPNIGWDAPPERGSNTNPKLVGRIVKRCYEAGAKEVYVFDNSCDEWTKSYRNSGIEEAVKAAGGKMVTGKSESMYKEVSIPRGKNLKSARVHELIVNCDVFINVPVLKHHGGSTVTAGMKNMMGVVWDRRFWHKNDLHQCIADFATYRRPNLTVLDAYRVIKKNGPKGVSVGDVSLMKSLLVSPDIVAIDAAGAKMFGVEPHEVKYIPLAHEAGVGNSNTDSLRIKRIKI